MCLMSYANNNGADQTAHPRSLINIFVVCCLDSIISLDSIAEISRLWLVSVAQQACLCLAWSETPEDTFCRDEAHIWTASIEFGTYRICEQRRFRRACASAQSRQNLRCSLMQAVSREEPSDRKPDPWPLWMAGHAQLKFVMTECSKTKFAWRGSFNKIHRYNWKKICIVIFIKFTSILMQIIAPSYIN